MIDWAVRDLAETLRIPREKVRVVSPFIGGGFGAKLWIRGRCACWPRSARARRGRPVKVALRAAADAQQHHAPPGDHPAHPPRRHAATARSPRSRMRAGRQPARRQAGDRASARRACSMPAPNRMTAHASGGARPARGQRHARAGRGAGDDGARDRHGRDGREARPRSGRVPHPQRHAGRSREARPAILAAPAGPSACAPAPRGSAGASAIRDPAQTRDGRWLVGMGVAAAFRNNLLDEVGRARAPRRPRHR